MLSQFFYYTETPHRFYRKAIAKFIYSKNEIDKVNFPFHYKIINETISYEQYINDLKFTGNFLGNMKLLV